jgi:hypothetical protein
MRTLANIVENITSDPKFATGDGTNILKMMFECRLGIVLRTNLDHTNMNIVHPTLRCLARLFRDKSTSLVYEVTALSLPQSLPLDCFCGRPTTRDLPFK